MKSPFVALMMSTIAMTAVMADVPLEQCTKIKGKEKTLSPFEGIILLNSGILKSIRLEGFYASQKEDIKDILPPHNAFVNGEKPELLEHNVPLDPVAALAQYLFPSVDGAILTHNERNKDVFGFIAKAEKEGKKYGVSLINDLFKELIAAYGPLSPDRPRDKEFDEGKLEKIVSEWMGKVTKVAKFTGRDKGEISKDPTKVLTAALKECLSPSSEQSEKDNLYPPYMALNMLVAFAFRIANTPEEFAQLDTLVSLSEGAEPFSESVYDNKVKLFKESLAENDKKKIDPKEIFLLMQGYAAYKSNVPPLVHYRTTTYTPNGSSSISYPDCGETSLLNFFRIVLGKQGAFSQEHIQAFKEKLAEDKKQKLDEMKKVDEELHKEKLAEDEKEKLDETKKADGELKKEENPQKAKTGLENRKKRLEAWKEFEKDQEGAHTKLLAFFKSNYLFSKAFTNDGHVAWSQVVSNLNSSSENNPVTYGNPSLNPVCNIKAYAGVSNMLSVIEKLIPHSELMEPWADKEEEQLKQVARKLTALCRLFSRDDFLLDWHYKGKKEIIQNTSISIDFTINGKTAFGWRFKRGHFEIFDCSMKWGDWRGRVQFKDPRLTDSLLLQSLFVDSFDSAHQAFHPHHLWGSLRMDSARNKALVLYRVLEKSAKKEEILPWARVILERNFPLDDNHANELLWPLWSYYKDLVEKNAYLKKSFEERLKQEKKPSLKEMLVSAVDLGYTEVVKHIISHPDLSIGFNEKMLDGETLLHGALKRKNQEVVHTLVRARAGVDVRNTNGHAPIHIAIRRNDNALIDLLLENNADKNVFTPPPHKEGVIHLAAAYGNEALVQRLVKEDKSQISTLDVFNETPLHKAVREGHKNICQLLLDQGADVNAQNTIGETPLHFAARQKHGAVLKLLLENKATINIKDKQGFSPLYYAMENNDEEAVTLLLDAGADVNAGNRESLRPLHIAVRNKDTKTAKILLDKGAKPSDYLREGNIQRNSLAMAIDNDDEEMVRLIIGYEPEIERISCTDGTEPFQRATCIDAVKHLEKRSRKKQILDLVEEYNQIAPRDEVEEEDPII